MQLNSARTEVPPTPAMKDALEYFKTNNGKDVLEAGCGIGTWSIYLAEHGLRVKGFDFSESAIALAEEWACRKELDIEFLCAPLTAPPFPGETFDAVLAAFVLERLSRRETFMALEALSARLRRGGLFFALFSPYLAPEEMAEKAAQGVTYTNYKDSEIKASFIGFRLVEARSYPQGARGYFLKKNSPANFIAR